jgi:hypothetical protein
MAERFKELTEEHFEFIQQQHVFFVGTAGAKGTVNVSPKGLDTLRITSKSRVVWLNLAGSGNETAIHVQENGRMTLAFCSFAKQPLILRLYGKADVINPEDNLWEELSGLFEDYASARQIFLLNIDLVQTSCGFTIPFYEYLGERNIVTTDTPAS